MAKAEIPKWFNLETYQIPLSHDQWGVSIDMRAMYLDVKPLLSKKEQIDFFKVFAGRLPEDFAVEHHTDPFPVRSMNAADLAVISASWSNDPAWQMLFQKVCSVVGKDAPATLLDEVVAIYQEAPSMKKEALENVGWLAPEFCHGVPITVDLNSDDETLKLAFSVWLAGVRSDMNERFKKPISEDDFQKWHKYRILAAFDLYQLADITGTRFTNSQMANALFPPASVSIEDRDVDMGERIRKVTKPLMDQTITFETVRLIRATTRLEKYLGQVIEDEKNTREILK
ncbi:DUF6387 family protein [Pseudomonas piscis]|uniref:Uncharacterized protein n=1 Tax=Pseudomonas piscis TaxID=2614538 RepID=A0A7X1U816_9PSED|nr:DUF6387 family protein [Pseudomonas piscis]MQA57658.1 hypothetical protein [Pseudomonas piscis]